MNPKLTRASLTLFAFTVLAALVLAEQQSRTVLGKIDYQALLEAAPGIPATTAEAGKRAYGPDIKTQPEPVALDSFYDPFYKRVAAARDVIKDAVANRRQDQEALMQRSVAQTNANPIVNNMGGIDKISNMSEAETQQAAAKAVGTYQQSLSGAPGNPSSGGMQAMMERMMNDPAYQERFDKMTKKEQEAEIQKYMGNAQAPAPPTGETAAERRAKQATQETTGVVAKQNELAAIIQRLRGIDEEFTKKDQAILASPGGHDQIGKEIGARMEKIPVIQMGEMYDRDPAKVQVLQREQATRDRTRATWELQQRAAIYTQRKARSKEVAAAYTVWLRQNIRPVNSQTAQLLDDATVQIAVSCEEDLIGLSEKLGKYTAEATSYAAQYERWYQTKMSEPTVQPSSK